MTVTINDSDDWLKQISCQQISCCKSVIYHEFIDAIFLTQPADREKAQVSTKHQSAALGISRRIVLVPC
jgi:hypothetical protein